MVDKIIQKFSRGYKKTQTHSNKKTAKGKKKSYTLSLRSKKGVEMVRREQIDRYREFDRRVNGKGKKHLQSLKKDILENGLHHPLELAVSRESGRCYLFEGNHRLVCLQDIEAEWVPVRIHYIFYNDKDDERYPVIPGIVLDEEDWPEEPLPSLMGFETKELPET